MEKSWTEILAAAKNRGFVSVGELATRLDMKWDHVLTWIQKAGLYPDDYIDLSPRRAKMPDDQKRLSIPKRCGLWLDDAEELVEFIQDTFNGYKAADDVANKIS